MRLISAATSIGPLSSCTRCLVQAQGTFDLLCKRHMGRLALSMKLMLCVLTSSMCGIWIRQGSLGMVGTRSESVTSINGYSQRPTL
jgi:hypothetical protein